jgi:hypothetical protein
MQVCQGQLVGVAAGPRGCILAREGFLEEGTCRLERRKDMTKEIVSVVHPCRWESQPSDPGAISSQWQCEAHHAVPESLWTGRGGSPALHSPEGEFVDPSEAQEGTKPTKVTE